MQGKTTEISDRPLKGVTVRCWEGRNSRPFETLASSQKRYRRKGTGHHLRPNLVILRGHAFNSSAAPPLNGLKNSTNSTDSFSALGARDPQPVDTASRHSPRLP